MSLCHAAKKENQIISDLVQRLDTRSKKIILADFSVPDTGAPLLK